jgi:hypothetical protein
MKPMTAITLTMEKMNSASPYPFTPNKLIAMIVKRNMVTNIAWGKVSFQKLIVMDAEMTSRGKTTSHCIA